MKVFIALVLVGLCSNIFADEKVRYDNFKVFRVTPKSREAAEILRHLEENTDAYDFWKGVTGVGYPVDIMVPPHMKYRFNDTISSGEFDVEEFISNVQELIDNENPRTEKSLRMDWTRYHTLDEINQWLRDLANQYSEVTLVTAGRSYQGRDILGVRVSFRPGNEDRTVFIESGIHAREWISSAVTTYILNQLLTSTNTDIRQIAENHDWYFVPVFNPDGFLYSHTTDRMWRKTRTPYTGCSGADPNRNWGYYYNTGGTSNSPCSETYRGPNAFSETSVRSISEFILTIGTRLFGYISFHSYSQLMLLPYGYTSAHLDNYNQLYTIGVRAANSLAQRYGTSYRVGNIPEVLYVASGGSMDWVKGTFGTPITYTYELRDTGLYGFILPANQILPSGLETMDSLVTILQEAAKL